MSADLSTLLPHTACELTALLELLRGVDVVTVGSGRDAAARRAAETFADAWRSAGGLVLATVDWPEDAASWLRPARRFSAGAPDAWVVAGAPQGWARMSRRLRASTDWDPGRTFGFAALGTSETVRLAGPGTLAGMRGATAEGGTWRIGRHSLRVEPRPPRLGS